MTWWQEGDFLRASGFFEAARERNPQDMGSVIGLLSMYRILGKYPEAMGWVVWLEGQGGASGRKASRYLRGRILYEEKRFEEAEPLLREALAMAGESGYILGRTGFTMVDCEFYLAQIAVRRGDMKGADALFRAYVRRNSDPDFADYARLVFNRGSQEQRAMYDEMEACWIRIRQ
jgi:tetratricopeptide (TPR) repeat protein